jgi:hypothetical protein
VYISGLLTGHIYVEVLWFRIGLATIVVMSACGIVRPFNAYFVQKSLFKRKFVAFQNFSGYESIVS